MSTSMLFYRFPKLLYVVFDKSAFLLRSNIEESDIGHLVQLLVEWRFVLIAWIDLCNMVANCDFFCKVDTNNVSFTVKLDETMLIPYGEVLDLSELIFTHSSKLI